MYSSTLLSDFDYIVCGNERCIRVYPYVILTILLVVTRGVFEYTLKWFSLYIVSSNEVYSSTPLSDLDYIVSSNEMRFPVYP